MPVTRDIKPLDDDRAEQHYAWREAISAAMPELAARVFGLRRKAYWGSGFHYSLERRLGALVANVNDYDTVLEHHHVAVETVAYRHLMRDIEQAEWSAEHNANPTAPGAPWGPPVPAMTETKEAHMTLYTRTTQEFDPTNPAGTFVCAEELIDTYGFSELGYDRIDYGRPPLVWEVSTDVERFISTETLVRVCNQAGIRIFQTYEEHEEAVAEGYEGPAYGEDDFLCMEEESLNSLLEREDVRAAVEAAGYEAARDYVTVSNMQPLLTVFWKPGSFSLEGPLPLVVDDPDHPHHVAVADRAPTP